MPWKIADVDGHIKGLTPQQKKQWVAVANSALSKCQVDGKDNCDASAIRQANGAVKKTESYVSALEVIDEAGRMISSANKKVMNDAIAALKAAMEHINNLISDESVQENQGVDPVLKLAEQKKWHVSGIKLEEAAKTLAQSDSYDAKRGLVSAALRQRAMAEMAQQKLSAMADYEDWDYGYNYSCMPYIRDMYDSSVVYSQEKELYQCDYSISGNDVTLGDPVTVQVAYVAAPSSAQESQLIIQGELIELKERAVNNDGKARIKLISPGWGSSGYYSEEMLKRDGPKVFTKGKHMYINHPTAEDDLNRPERDLKDLAGVLDEDATYEENGPTGKGLYANATVFDTYRQFIDEAAPYIGTSIRASGRALEGEAEGRHGMVIEGLVEGHSVDYVTLPGRGGEVLPLLEAARTKVNITREERVQEIEVPTVTEEEAKALRESVEASNKKNSELETQIARMREREVLREAHSVAVNVLAGIDLPDMTRVRLAEKCSKNPPIKDNELDREVLTEAVKAEAIEELKYIESVRGTTVSTTTVRTETLKDEDVNSALESAFRGIGLSEKAAKTAANVRG